MELSPEGIPILDISTAVNGHSNAQLANLANHLADACESIGCFYIKNHAVDQDLIDKLANDLRTFFDQPIEYKKKYQNVDSDWTRKGYYPFNSLNTYAYMGVKDKPNDQYETFNFGPSDCEYPTSPNLYPDYPTSLKENVDKYYESLRNLSMIMMRILGFAVNTSQSDLDYFYKNSYKAPHSLIANFFPSYSRPDRTPENWMPTHTDMSPVAILAQDPYCPNTLRVRNAHGEWIFANPVPGAFFVNLGRTLQRWTNGKWIATEHGVVFPENNVIPDRLSLVYFIGLHPDAVIQCLPSCGNAKYEPITFQELVEKGLEDLLMAHSE